jgi:hypothetical protein
MIGKGSGRVLNGSGILSRYHVLDFGMYGRISQCNINVVRVYAIRITEICFCIETAAVCPAKNSYYEKERTLLPTSYFT